jgi:RNA polymerase sigma-70 factor (ECF subfamily)
MDLVPPASPRAEEDRILIIAARNGEPKAFEKLMQRYRKSVYYTLLKMVRNEEDAEDLTQEAFAKAFSSIQNFDAKYSFSTWLFRIATNNCIDFIRKKKLQTLSIHASASDSGTQTGITDIRDADMNPNEQMLSDQRKKIVHDAVEKLSPRYKQLIELRFFQELSYEEIAETLDLPLGTVKAQLHRAKELLNNMMNHLEDRI